MLHIAVPLWSCAPSQRPPPWRSHGPGMRTTALTTSWCLLVSVWPHTVRRLLLDMLARTGCSVTSCIPTMWVRSPAAIACPDEHCRVGDAHLPVLWTYPSLLARGHRPRGGTSTYREARPQKQAHAISAHVDKPVCVRLPRATAIVFRCGNIL